MSKTFAVDNKNDIYIGLDGLLAIKTNLYSVLQNCQTAAQAQLGEMVLSIDDGVPNFQTIWQSAANVAQFEAYLRRTILKVDGVKEIKNLTIVVENNALSYTAEILTDYGLGVFGNG